MNQARTQLLSPVLTISLSERYLYKCGRVPREGFQGDRDLGRRPQTAQVNTSGSINRPDRGAGQGGTELGGKRWSATAETHRWPFQPSRHGRSSPL